MASGGSRTEIVVTERNASREQSVALRRSIGRRVIQPSPRSAIETDVKSWRREIEESRGEEAEAVSGEGGRDAKLPPGDENYEEFSVQDGDGADGGGERRGGMLLKIKLVSSVRIERFRRGSLLLRNVR